jgi:hypothetical protein
MEAASKKGKGQAVETNKNFVHVRWLRIQGESGKIQTYFRNFKEYSDILQARIVIADHRAPDAGSRTAIWGRGWICEFAEKHIQEVCEYSRGPYI